MDKKDYNNIQGTNKIIEQEQISETKTIEDVDLTEEEIPQEEENNINKKGTKQEIEQTMGEEKNEFKNKRKKIILYTLIASVCLIGLLIFSTIFALINVNNTKMISGISIKGIDISGLTIEEATSVVTEALENRLNKDILLKYNNELEISVRPQQINFEFNVKESINDAYNIGRDGNILTNNYKILFTTLFKQDINPKISYDEVLLDNLVKDISAKLPGAMVDNTYYIEEESLIILKGKPGLIIEKEELKNALISEIENGYDNKKFMDIIPQEKAPNEINIEQIYSEIHKQPQDAYFTANPFTIYPHVNGVDFKITMEQAKEILSGEGTEFTIPLKITIPVITTNKIGTEVFPNLLSSYSTKYDESNRNRSTNIRLATEKINGTVLLPGETFSYNKVVGKRTSEAGYKVAAVYSGGRVVDGIGGGICQVSTTLYNSVLLANLEVNDRSNHMFLTGYVPAGRDATVNYGTIDFVFTNNRKYPIKIVCSAKNGISKFEIFGIQEEVEYEVVIESRVIRSIPYTTKYIEDSSLESGRERLEQSGANGCISEAYKVLKLNGIVVSRTLLSKDTYNAKQKIVRKGTKGVTNIVTPSENNNSIIDPITSPENTVTNIQVDEGT